MKKMFIKTSTWPSQFIAVLTVAWLLPSFHCTGQWIQTTDLPVLKTHHSAIAASNGKVYLFGGDNGSGVCTNDVYEFDPADSSFTPKASMPGARCGAAVAEKDGKIYLFGGFIQFGGLVSNSVYEYDPGGGGTWKTLAVMPTKRGYASATLMEDKIYVIGGAGDYGMTGSDAVEVFDPEVPQWLAPAPSLLKTRGGHVSHEVEGKIYVLGGTTSLQDNAEKTVEMFDPVNSGYWSVVDSIPTPRLFLCSCKGPDNKIYAIGGYNYGVGPTLPSVDVYVPQNGGTWETITSMYTPRRGFAAASVPVPGGFRIYAYGGNNETSVLKSVEVYDAIFSLSHEVKSVTHFDPQLRSIPNPANGVTTIFYRLAASDEVELSLYDNYGRLARMFVNARQAPGEYSVDFDTSPLPKGVYTGILRMNKGQAAQMRLVVQ